MGELATPKELKKLKDSFSKTKVFKTVRKNKHKLSYENQSFLKELSRPYFKQYSKNFDYYWMLVGKRPFGNLCRQNGVKHTHATVTNYDRLYSDAIEFKHILLLSHLSKLPVGVWMHSDIEYLHKNMVINFETHEATIGAPYFTDGVYFYSQHLDQFAPIGNNFLKERVEENFKVKAYKL